MLINNKYFYSIESQYNLTGYPIAKLINVNNIINIRIFIIENILLVFSCLLKIIINKGFKNKSDIPIMLKSLRI